MPDTEEGWVLRLLCIGCQTRVEFRDVVPSLVVDRARKAGWDFDPTETWITSVPALCPEHVHA